MTDEVARALLMSELPIPGTPMRPASGPSVDEVFTNVGHRLNRKLEGYVDGVARALSAPARAMQGGYNYIEINPDGSINQIPTAMIDDAAALAGLASVGSMPIPRPAGSLGAGGGGYGMRHRPPNPKDDYGSYMDDVSGMFGDDIYSPNALDYFGTGSPKMDAESLSVIQRARGNPNQSVTIYRAIPNGADPSINPGDWVTTSKEYARIHGEGVLGGDFHIVEQKVPAKTLTNAGDIHEWGWWPE